ncbi:DNA polymerase IV [Clostridia bacterium]|nr:DNA polymerase IV [Clostridia bacterium]
MGDRVILHTDMNNCYASIEMFHNPKLRGLPLAVGGDAAERHGIILARSYETRPYGIKVGMALWQAKQQCPNLTIVPPNYPLYIRYSKMLRNILADYSEQQEAFGLDEQWSDVTGSVHMYGSGKAIADEVRERVKDEMGVTVSVGVSWNKIFAKLGSDIKKPDATTLITQDNYREVVWPLPAGDLLGVGRSTFAKLNRYGIKTIGEIAQCDPTLLHGWLGKWGLFLYTYANGRDTSPVARIGDEGVIKSVGNSTTCPRDLENDDDAKIVFLNLSESVAERMRELGLMARTVEISLRTNELEWCTRQSKLAAPTHISKELCASAMRLLKSNYCWEKPLRSIGIRGTDLVPIAGNRQMSMFLDEQKRDKAEKLEFTIDSIRKRFGHYSIMPGLLHVDDRLGKLNPKEDHVIHPVGYL